MSQDRLNHIGRAFVDARAVLTTEFWGFQPTWLAQAAFIYLVVRMNDVLGGLKAIDRPVNFRDDIALGDITSLVNTMRNASCHFGSNERRVREGGTVFLILVGQQIGLLVDGVPVHVNPYPDDVLFAYGDHGIFVRRHVLRALQEARIAMVEVAERDGLRMPYVGVA